MAHFVEKTSFVQEIVKVVEVIRMREDLIHEPEEIFNQERVPLRIIFILAKVNSQRLEDLFSVVSIKVAFEAAHCSSLKLCVYMLTKLTKTL